MNSSELISHIQSFSKKPMVLVEMAHTNHGDRLILEKTEEFLILNNFKYTKIDFNIANTITESHLIIVGNGALNSSYPFYERWCKRIVPTNDITFFPSSCDVDYIKQIRSHNVKVFAREHATKESLLNSGINCSYHSCITLISNKYPTTKGDGVVSIFRDDVEKSDQIFKPLGVAIEYNSLTYESWKSIIESSSEIHTDLLHTAIYAVKCGKSVTIYPGKLDKQYNVWVSDLKDLGVTFYTIK